MNSTLRKIGLGVLTLLLSMAFIQTATAQKKTKKQKKINVERVIDAPMEAVWRVVAEDFGAVSKSHPLVVESVYTDGSLKGELGAARVCYFKKNKKQMLKEKIVGWRPEQMELDVAIIDTKRFPLDTNNTVFTVKLEPTMNGGTKVNMLMKYRTKPAMMGGMMKKSFTKRLNDYLLAVHHHVKTGETVTVNNFKGIKKQYASR